MILEETSVSSTTQDTIGKVLPAGGLDVGQELLQLFRVSRSADHRAGRTSTLTHRHRQHP
jgi:hypothetical protein